MAVSYHNKTIHPLQQLADQCLHVIELVQAAEFSRLKAADLSALSQLAYASQLNDANGLLQALQTLADEFNNNLYTKYCDPIIMGFVGSVKALSEPQLTSLNCANAMFANQANPQVTASHVLGASAA
jgi:hypothetical protein